MNNEFDRTKLVKDLTDNVEKDRKLIKNVMNDSEKYKSCLEVHKEDNVSYLRYKKRRVKELNGVNWIYHNVHQTPWMHSQYNTLSGGTIQIQTQVVEGSLDPIFEQIFAEEIKEKAFDEVSTSVKKLDEVIRNYPHQEIETYARYLKVFMNFLEKQGFEERPVKKFIQKYVASRIEGYMKMKKNAIPIEQAREEALMASVCPSYNNVRKDIFKDVIKIENEDFALSTSFLKMLD